MTVRRQQPDPAKRKRIASFVKNGGTITDATKHFSVNKYVVTDACNEHGVPIPRAGNGWVKERKTA